MSDDSFPSRSTPGAALQAGAGPLALPADPLLAARMEKWLAIAMDPRSADTQLFAKLIAARDVRNELALLGLQRCDWDALRSRHFSQSTAPGASRTTWIVEVELISHHAVNVHAGFLDTLHALLLSYASPAVNADDADNLATIIAHACLRPDHLWRDLGLAGRDEVTWMLTRYFPALVALNVENLRWKKFLARQRALSLGLPPGPAPGCPGCEDYGFCFASQRE